MLGQYVMIGMRKKTMHEQLGEVRAKESEQQQQKMQSRDESILLKIIKSEKIKKFH